MANRFVNPFPQFLDSTPEVRAGAKLFFYEAGTSTKLDTFTVRTLTLGQENTNPVVLNSAGYPGTDIWLQDLDYKVVLAPSTDTDPPSSPIWTADYVRARDSALIAKTVTGSGSPNGSVAGTAGSASILPDFYWDYTNSILYVCTITGDASSAVWTAINASSATPSVPPPQGRLTLTSATPVISTGVSAATAVYYTPYAGNLVPVYNGTSLVPTTFSELTLSLVSSHAANAIYDVFAFSNSGVVTLVTGPAWTTATAGSGARGSGAATTELTRVGGIFVNAVSMSARNGSTTYTVNANAGTYLGSIFMDGTNGQVSCHVSWGQSRKWGVWNAYNRVPVILQAGDATASWNYATSTIRASNGASTNSLTIFTGLAEEQFKFSFLQQVAADTASAALWKIGIGYNSTTTFSGTNGLFQVIAGQSAMGAMLFAQYDAPPILGISTITALENANSAQSGTFQGQQAGMLLRGEWRA